MKNTIVKLVLGSTLLAGFSLQADLPQPYASILPLPQSPYFVQDAYVFYNLINTNSSAVIVDVESADGGVARFVAQQVNNNNLTSVKQIYSVSGWQSADRSQKDLYQHFLSNVIAENTTQLITPIRMSAQEGAKELNVKADFITVVGGNDSNGIYNDILAWVAHLNTSGIICGNNWYDPAVQVGVTKAALALDMTLKLSDNVWYLQKGV